jgi:SAM-dependent methyltransferase
MEETLSKHIVADPADRVPVAARAGEMRAGALVQNECNQAGVASWPAPDPGGETLRSGGEDDLICRLLPHIRFVETPQPFRKPADAGQRVVADVLHVGCGACEIAKLPLMFRNAGWREIRLDIDPEVKPDIVASITEMRVIADSAVDAVYSSHNVEHLYPHEVPLALREMNRVLRPGGFAFIKLPDLQEVARFIADGKLEDALYLSPMGEIAPLDILYGHRPSLARGNTFMAHRTGFTGNTLAAALIGAGFAAVMLQRDLPSFSLTAVAFRTRPDAEQTTTWRMRLVPAADRPTVLYTRND